MSKRGPHVPGSREAHTISKGKAMSGVFLCGWSSVKEEIREQTRL